MHDTCVRCAYDLRGVANDQPCSECGLLAERSRRVSAHLRDGRPGYLRRLSLGVCLILLSAIGSAAWYPLLILLPVVVSLPAFRNAISGTHLRLIGLDFAAIGFFVGTWLITTREGGIGPVYPFRRRLVRLLSTLPNAAMLLSHLYFDIEAVNWGGSGAVFGLVTDYAIIDGLGAAVSWLRDVLLAAGLLLLPPLLGAHLHDLGKRLLSRQITEHSLIVGFGITATALFIGLVAVLSAFAEELGMDSNWANRSNLWATAMGVGFSLVILFWLWTLYLLARLAVAFRRESVELRSAWAAADMSAA